MPIKIARISNTYGPRMQPDDGRVVSNFILQALRGEFITIYGDGMQSCKRAVVRYDLRDLVFLHLGQNGLPLGQPAPKAGETCSCLGEKGCMVDRLMRPFMCTWYLSPGQMAVVRREKSWREYGLPERLREIQKDRKELEKRFLALVGPYLEG